MFNLKILIMSLRDLLESGANVSVTVTLDDLRTIFHEAAKGARSAVQEQPAEELPDAQGCFGSFENRLFDTLVLGEDRIY